MNKNTAINYFGNKNRLAIALNISRQAIQKWGEKVPSHRQIQIQLITKGALQANRQDVMST